MEQPMKNRIKVLLAIITLLLAASCSDEPNRAPTVNISATPMSGNVPLTVHFTADAGDPDGNSLGYDWDFGDGSAHSTNSNPSHIFTGGGSFTVTCIVTDNGVPPLSASHTVVITAQNDIPVVTALSPAWNVIHMPAFTLSVTGSRFSSDAKIIFNGSEKETTYVSDRELRCEITPSDTLPSAAAGVEKDSSINVSVLNPAPGGGSSDSLPFVVRDNHTFTEANQIHAESGDYSLSINSAGGLQACIERDYTQYPVILQSTDLGGTWSEGVELPEKILASFSSEEGNIRIFYDEPGEGLCFSESTDGVNWSEPVFLQEHPDEGNYYWERKDLSYVAMDDDTILTFWKEDGILSNGGSSYLGGKCYFSKTTDGGESWSAPRQIPDDDYAYNPHIACSTDGKRIYLFYEKGSEGVAYRTLTRSDDEGENWSAPVSLPSREVQYEPAYPYPGTGSALYRLVLMWMPGLGSFYVYTSTDSGVTWSGRKHIDTVYHMDIHDWNFLIDSSDNLHIFYSAGYAAWNEGLYYRRSYDGGLTWTKRRNVSSAGFNSSPSGRVIEESGNIYLLWHDIEEPYAVYFSRNTRGE